MKRLQKEFARMRDEGFSPASNCNIEGWGLAAVAVAAVGAVAGGAISANAAGQASAAQQQAAANATQEQLATYNASSALQAPGRNLGYGADSLLAQLYGIPDPNAQATTNSYSANQNANALTGGGGVTGTNTSGAASTAAPKPAAPNYSGFENSPGYTYALSQGQQAVNRGAAAQGSLYTPNTLNQLDTNAQGIASQQYNNYVSQLMGLAGIGTGATNATTNAAGTAGNNISANDLSAGNANASGVLGTAGAYSSGIQGASNAFGNYAQLSNANSGSTGYQTVNGGYVFNGVEQNGGQGGGIGNIVGDF